MTVFLAWCKVRLKNIENKELLSKINSLWSYYYFSKVDRNAYNFKRFILDSGVHTFQMSKEISFDDLLKYTEKYCKYINKHKIENFVEMDMDRMLDDKKILYLRKYIEDKTGRKPILVFHHNRGIKGLEENIEYSLTNRFMMISDYIFNMYFSKHTDKLKKICKTVQSYGIKTHLLGSATSKVFFNYGFNSGDSSSVFTNARGGGVLIFDKNTLKTAKIKNRKLKETNKSVLFKINEYIKYQNYMESFGNNV